ncbi:FG-GAP-like repeat-containing protein [Streptomyces sp. NPDC004330]|uniref:FG-GAP-like repeat-containing protein n=1 Tax=Streptomyces sp. NPDC004330 TaxID=3364700 RepID=UPI0036A06C6B
MHIRKALGSAGALLGTLAAGLLLGAPAARADDVPPASAPPLRFISFNMCGSGTMCEWNAPAGYTNKAKYDAVVNETAAADPSTATGWNADQIFLQETCRYQFDTLSAKLAPHGFSGHYVTTKNFGNTADKQCQKPAGDTESIQTGATIGDYGMAVFVKGAALARTELALGAYDGEDIVSPCIKASTQGRPTWACSVHLDWNTASDAGREQQARRLAQQADLWQAQGVPVSLGGDFNGKPGTAMAATFYEPTVGDGVAYGNGAFREVDETDRSHFTAACLSAQVTRCRSGATTFGVAKRKIDYIFLSARHFKDVVADAPPLVGDATDHQMLRGAAAWADCGTTCATDGLFRRDANGVLRRYAGRVDGSLSAPGQVGVGWGTMSKIARDGTTLVAADHDGLLWRYPADPRTGQYSGSTRILAGNGGWQNITTILAPGDFDGDGRTDLVARDKAGELWLYPGDGDDGYGTRRSIGTGWQMFDVLLAPGDFDGDGKADLIGRTPVGDLWFYAGDGAGSYAPRVRIGVDWERYTALAAPGDLDGDGKADLIGRTPAGDLWFYAGDGAASYAPAAQVGYGYPAGELLF